MNRVCFLLYNGFWLIVYILTLPYVWFKRKKSPAEWEERMGNYDFDYWQDEKSIWIHGASMGEITAASRLVMRIKEKFPSRRIIVSAMTLTGKERAKRIMKGTDNFIIMAFDFFPLVKKAIRKVNPKTLILVETEVWPSLIYICKSMGIKIVLINGRISDRTYRRYLNIKYISRCFFNQIDLLLPQNRSEQNKFLKLGVGRKKIKLIGPLKSDNSNTTAIKRSSLSIPEHKSVIVAGSVRKGEEQIIIRAFANLRKKLNDVYLVIAPRHLNRVYEIENLLMKKEIPYRKRNEQDGYNNEDVLILNTMGELRNVYSIANIAFVGGTLLPYGGHNLLEPAFSGVPVIFGQYVNNTKEIARELIASNSAKMVKGEKELEEIFSYLLTHPAKRKAMGKNSEYFIENRRGIVDKYLQFLADNGIF
jgi:3-deoxy-D-manno-octulosonic-acid transferase